MLFRETINSLDLDLRKLTGLARLSGQQIRHLIFGHAPELDESEQTLPPLLDRGVLPRLEGSLCGLDGIVQIVLVGDWDIPELLLCCGVDAMVDGLAGSLFPVYDVVELVVLERCHLGGRHGLNEASSEVAGLEVGRLRRLGIEQCETFDATTGLLLHEDETHLSSTSNINI